MSNHACGAVGGLVMDMCEFCVFEFLSCVDEHGGEKKDNSVAVYWNHTKLHRHHVGMWGYVTAHDASSQHSNKGRTSTAKHACGALLG